MEEDERLGALFILFIYFFDLYPAQSPNGTGRLTKKDGLVLGPGKSCGQGCLPFQFLLLACVDL